MVQGIFAKEAIHYRFTIWFINLPVASNKVHFIQGKYGNLLSHSKEMVLEISASILFDLPPHHHLADFSAC
jgi:hypothetical protein